VDGCDGCDGSDDDGECVEGVEVGECFQEYVVQAEELDLGCRFRFVLVLCLFRSLRYLSLSLTTYPYATIPFLWVPAMPSFFLHLPLVLFSPLSLSRAGRVPLVSLSL